MGSDNFRVQISESRAKGFQKVQHLLPFVPTPDERTVVALSFMLCLSVGLAVFCLLAFHCYLLLTAQTTIEFHGNCSKRRRARNRGTSWINPYDLGPKENWQLVYGSRHPLISLLPSNRDPEFLPFPIGGKLIRRHPKGRDTAVSSEREGEAIVV